MGRLFAVCVPGIEPLLGRELRELSVEGREVAGGVELEGGIDALSRVNLWSRVASRVLLRLGEVKATAFPELVRKAAALPWENVVRPGARVAFRVTCRKSRLYHSGAVAERLHAALQQAVRGVEVVDYDEDEPAGAQLFLARFDRDVCTVSADTSGALLHQRGYRIAPGKAPLRETLAAAMLLGARWSPQTPLLDPLCGSGTIPIEAALIASGRPPNAGRPFAFEKWPGVKPIARDERRPAAAARIEGSDSDPQQLAAARQNAARAGVEVTFVERDVRDLPRSDALIVTNPPYGVRIGHADELRSLWRTLHASGHRVIALSPDERPAGLQWRKLLTTQNGGLRVHLIER